MAQRNGLSRAVWRTSSYTGSNSGGGGECVEVGYLDDVRGVRDTKHRIGPVLAFDSPAWASFIRTLKS